MGSEMCIRDSPLPERRSARQRALAEARTSEPLSYAEPAADERRPTMRRGSNEPSVGPVDPAEAEADIEAAAVAMARRELPEPSADSCRTFDIDVCTLLAAHLGRRMEGPPTKASVVAALAGGERKPKFSKYSGSLEWRNAVVLWVNVGGADYANLFLDGGRRMSWFASQRHDAGSPIVQRLLATKRSATTVRDSLLLFCRLPGEPYVCCGRLEYVSHDPASSPLKFVWALIDADELLERSEAFGEIVAQGPAEPK